MAALEVVASEEIVQMMKFEEVAIVEPVETARMV
jgi:hypothetical protein